VRQGDPFALILYLLFIEPLLLMIRKMIPGVALGDMKVDDKKKTHLQRGTPPGDRRYLHKI
jgi:hypothetical protein